MTNKYFQLEKNNNHMAKDKLKEDNRELKNTVYLN